MTTEKREWAGFMKNNRINYYTEKDKEIKSTNIFVGHWKELTPVWGWKMSTMFLLFWLTLCLGIMKAMY